jgi:membrane protease YdiL (CAAX protease family)
MTAQPPLASSTEGKLSRFPKNTVQPDKRRFRLHEHPWLSLLAVIIAIVVSNILSIIVFFVVLGLSSDSPIGQFALGISYNVLTVFLFAPFVLRLPMGKRTFRQCLGDIGLTRVQPFFRLVLLALSCYLILALSQAAASFVYRLFQGLPITWSFIRQVFDVSRDLPPGSSSLLVSIPSAFEEAVFRGIVLTVFLSKYPERQAILFSALGFGLVHALHLVSGGDLVLNASLGALILLLAFMVFVVVLDKMWKKLPPDHRAVYHEAGPVEPSLVATQQRV